ncbi:MAG: hypothetical protein HY716_08040 [Planctomycetes bacterium]|nr:hypothetical protein [Planctomycetota bacterium]
MEIETDLDTFLAGEADRLRVIATALRGLARDSDATGESIESKALRGAAGELDGIAMRLDAVRREICQCCRMLEVEERVRVG